jgi:hypothetical protein
MNLFNQVLTCSYQAKQEVMATNKKQPRESVSGAAATIFVKLYQRYIWSYRWAEINAQGIAKTTKQVE